jgi:hypothetical protein
MFWVGRVEHKKTNKNHHMPELWNALHFDSKAGISAISELEAQDPAVL